MTLGNPFPFCELSASELSFLASGAANDVYEIKGQSLIMARSFIDEEALVLRINRTKLSLSESILNHRGIISIDNSLKKTPISKYLTNFTVVTISCETLQNLGYEINENLVAIILKKVFTENFLEIKPKNAIFSHQKNLTQETQILGKICNLHFSLAKKDKNYKICTQKIFEENPDFSEIKTTKFYKNKNISLEKNEEEELFREILKITRNLQKSLQIETIFYKKLSENYEEIFEKIEQFDFSKNDEFTEKCFCDEISKNDLMKIINFVPEKVADSENTAKILLKFCLKDFSIILNEEKNIFLIDLDFKINKLNYWNSVIKKGAQKMLDDMTLAEKNE